MNKKEQIFNCCLKISDLHNVSLLFAVENGSRAWRLSSKNSDYDVRFVYYRSLEEYLKISKPRGVITFQEDDLDLVGFDIYKFCGLLKASNPTVIEWLTSDMVYAGEQPWELIEFAEENFNPKALYWHYTSMGKQNYLKYLKSGKDITYKKYLYAMRGLLNAKYVKKYLDIPPINFVKAVDLLQQDIPAHIQRQLADIIKKKAKGNEKDIVQNQVQINNYIESELKTASESFCIRKRQLDNELNDFILDTLGLIH